MKRLIDMQREIYLTNDEVSPPDETVLARQFFSIPSSEGVRTSQLGPEMTEPTKGTVGG